MNYVHGYDRKIILLFEMSVTCDCAAFQHRCHSEVSPLLWLPTSFLDGEMENSSEEEKKRSCLDENKLT